jgi:ATP-dependent RNA helicase DeaD
MGFIEDIEKIFSQANAQSRVLLFSATMPPPILKIASKFMGEYEIIEEETPPEEPVLTEQMYWVVREQDKVEALVRLIDAADDFYGLVFTQTKVDADMVCRELDERGFDVQALHGDIAQQQREKILARFRMRKTKILVATDVAARGIDIEGLTHVVNYALPFDPGTYVHRIGRTGRAGASGKAYSLVRPEERRRLEFLKAAAKKATKGKMEMESPPSIHEVFAAKTERIVRELCADDLSVSVSGETDSGLGVAANVSALTQVAAQITERLGAQEALRRVLARAFAAELSSERYREINEVRDTPRGRGAGSSMAPMRGAKRSPSQGAPRAERFSALDGVKQIRLYVNLGFRDGSGPREVAQFFSGLVKIPQRLVDRIEVTDSFSLLSLPLDAGLKALAMANSDKKLPHMHVDVKEGGDFSDEFLQSELAKRNSRSRSGNREVRDSFTRETGKRSGAKSSPREKDFPKKSRARTETAVNAESKGASAYKRKRTG